MKRLLTLSALLGLAAACAPATVEIILDSDEDGLMDDEEASMGLDPSTPDSDGDGYLDLEEVDAGTDPIDAADHPYLGGWPMDGCADSITSSGDAEGEIASGFELQDQFGEMVNVYDFCDRAVMLVSAAFW